MQILTYSIPEKFVALIQPMLELRESENNLMLGVALRLVEHPEWTETPPYLAAVLDGAGDPGLAAVITPPNNLLLAAASSADQDWLAQALPLLVQDLLDGGWPVPGVLAENSLAAHFADSWQRATGRPYRLNMAERIYELRRVIPLPHPPAGFFRLATEDDLEIVTAWIYAFGQEAMGRGTLEEAHKMALQRIPVGNVFLWEDGSPVSMSFSTRPTPHGCTVTSVYTPPELRGRGYASACVAALSQLLLESGKLFCNLFTNLANPVSNSIYMKIGYEPVCDFSEYRFAIVGQS